MTALSLAGDFPAPTRAQWRERAAAVLQKTGAAPDVDPDDALTVRTVEGLAIRPLYTAEDAPRPAYSMLPERSGGGAWDVRQRVDEPEPAAANRAALLDLENGVTSLWLPGTDLAAVLEGVYLDLAPVALDAGRATRDAAAALLALAGDRGLAPGDLAGTLGADPLGAAFRDRAAPDDALLADLLPLVADHPRLAIATVDGTAYHDAGAGDADEVAVVTAVGVAYLRTLTAAGLSVADALARLEFRFAVTDRQFESIAKLRAARRIWSRVAELCGASADEGRQRQHAVTSWAMTTRHDPYVNMLRGTVACFAAAVGGADAITVLPYDIALGRPDTVARRVARNTHAVLHDEASLARVVDPAAGSWFVESLTDEIARAAWHRFTFLDRAGGAERAIVEGSVAEHIAETAARRAESVARRTTPITGVSEFPRLAETLPVREPAPERPGRRWAEPFEALRDRSDALLAERGARPAVLLAALGPQPAHAARVGFATNLFNAGGLETPVATEGFGAALQAAGTTLACLCSSDKLYASDAAAALEDLRAAGATHVWLAGAPRDVAVDGFVHAGGDALAELHAAWAAIVP